jgi:hypothetical protein
MRVTSTKPTIAVTKKNAATILMLMPSCDALQQDIHEGARSDFNRDFWGTGSAAPLNAGPLVPLTACIELATRKRWVSALRRQRREVPLIRGVAAQLA